MNRFLFLKMVNEFKKRVLKESYDLPRYVKEDGTVDLFHYSLVNKDVFLLDPDKSAENKSPFSQREFSISSMPRAFYYVDPREKEKFFGGTYNLYVGNYPADKIMKLSDLPEEMVRMSRNPHYVLKDGRPTPVYDGKGSLNMDVLLNSMKDAGMMAYYYSTGNFSVVALMEPLEVVRVGDAERDVLETQGPAVMRGQ